MQQNEDFEPKYVEECTWKKMTKMERCNSNLIS